MNKIKTMLIGECAGSLLSWTSEQTNMVVAKEYALFIRILCSILEKCNEHIPPH